jgi:hypothetical protein
MRDIASMLFGREAGELLDLITGEGGVGRPDSSGEGTDREAVEQVLRSGEWCGSTPGRHSPGAPGRARRVF